MNGATFTSRETKIPRAEFAREQAVLIPVLVVSPSEDDHRLLRKILKPPAFHPLMARSLHEAEPLTVGQVPSSAVDPLVGPALAHTARQDAA